MPMAFEELDEITRKYMLEEFESEEQGGNPYRGKGLSAAGIAAFPGLMREAIELDDDDSLAQTLADPRFWNPTEQYERDGKTRERRVNIRQATERLARSEFNTWYVRGLSRRLLEEGVRQCEVYRAAHPKWEPADCADHEGQILEVSDVYRGHRVRYWPEPGNPDEISVPFQPGCHHTIRRTQ